MAELQTRLLLKYDTYQNWTTDTETTQANKTGANFVLKKGEMGICAIEAERSENPTVKTPTPTVLFKVGDGETPFKNLKWASALAADVYGWAKASDVRITEATVTGSNVKTKTLEFVGTNKSITLDYLSPAEVAAITDPLVQRIAAVEAKFSGDTSVEGQIAGLDERLDAIENTTTGVLATAKKYTDDREVEIKKYADQAEADALAAAKAYVDGADGVKQALAAHTGATGNVHNLQPSDIGLGNVENKSVATIKTELTGSVAENNANFATGGAVFTAIKNAKEAVEQQVTTLTNGVVKTNTEDIAKNAAAIKTNTDDIAKINAFFAAADHDGKDGSGLNDALDTLVEIQDFLNGEGQEVDQMLDAIGANTEAIEDIEEVLGNGTTDGLVKDNTANKEAIAGLQTGVATLNDIVNGYTSKDSIKTAVDAAQADATQALEDAANAQDAADAAQDGVDAINKILTGEGKLVETVGSHVQDIANIKANYIRTNGTSLFYGEDEIIFNCGNSGVEA
jgi:hypothetical protein